jgi:hypothetical protein
LNVQAAVLEILKGVGRPLHAKEIAEQIMAAGLWHSGGKTPYATVSARLYSDIKSNGDKSPFVKVGPQTFALRDPTEISSGTAPVPATFQETPKPYPTHEGFSFTDCAQKVLEAFGGKKPMHYKEITEKALEKGWLVTGGKTPDATMYAQVITEIKRQQKRGERPRFVQHGRGYVGLSQWMGRGLAFQIEQHNNQVRKVLRERLLAMKPGEFEAFLTWLAETIQQNEIDALLVADDVFDTSAPSNRAQELYYRFLCRVPASSITSSINHGKNQRQTNFGCLESLPLFFPVRIPRRPPDLVGPRHQIVSDFSWR